MTKKRKPSQFGGKISNADREKYSKSKHWVKDRFQNLTETSLSFSPTMIPRIIYKQLAGRKGRLPQENLAIQATDFEQFLQKDTAFIWYGHSVLLLRMKGKNILIDPMFGPNAAPIAPGGPARFSQNTLEIIDTLPEIDLVIFSHDHYDHLDLDSYLRLRPKVKHYFTAMGVARHLLAWGEDAAKINEFDWWQSRQFGDMDIHFTPSRHFAGRGLFDRQKSFWGGWLFDVGDAKIWFSGDGGYGEHFKEIGQKFGSIDLAFMECGQYNEDWRPVHMFPDEAVQAAIDAGVSKAIPVHWAGFSLSYQHSWKEPGQGFHRFAKEQELQAAFPRLGAMFDLDVTTDGLWWEDYL